MFDGIALTVGRGLSQYYFFLQKIFPLVEQESGMTFEWVWLHSIPVLLVNQTQMLTFVISSKKIYNFEFKEGA